MMIFTLNVSAVLGGGGGGWGQIYLCLRGASVTGLILEYRNALTPLCLAITYTRRQKIGTHILQPVTNPKHTGLLSHTELYHTGYPGH